MANTPLIQREDGKLEGSGEEGKKWYKKISHAKDRSHIHHLPSAHWMKKGLRAHTSEFFKIINILNISREEKKKKTVREEQKFRMALNFSSATLQLEDNDACLQNSRENESQSKDCTPTQTWLCPAGITLICNIQVLKNVTSRYIWLESCRRICYNWGCILRGRNTESQETNSLHRSPAKKNPQRYSYRATPQDESRLKRSRGDPRKDIRRNRTVFQNKANITEGGYVAELLELQARLTIL